MKKTTITITRKSRSLKTKEIIERTTTVVLNENNIKVLRALYDSSDGNGHDFGFTDSLVVEGMSKNQVNGHISSIRAKGFITENGDEDHPTQFQFIDLRAVQRALGEEETIGHHNEFIGFTLD